MKNKKPVFSSPRGAIVPDQSRLSVNELSRLRLFLPSSMTPNLQSAFLESSSKWVDFWEQEKSSDPLSHADIHRRIESLESAAKELQRAIEGLKGQPFEIMKSHFVTLTHGSAPPFDLPEEWRAKKIRFGSILEGAWETCQALRDAGEHTRGQVRVGRSIKPGQQNARGLASLVATGYADLFGELPPTTKESWFVGYMGTLGDILKIDVKFGHTMLASAMEGVHIPLNFQVERKS